MNIKLIIKANEMPHKNTKEKLCKTNAAIWYNKMCRENQLAPIYPS